MLGFGIGGLSLAILTSTPFLAQMDASLAPTRLSSGGRTRLPKDYAAQPPVETPAEKR